MSISSSVEGTPARIATALRLAFVAGSIAAVTSGFELAVTTIWPQHASLAGYFASIAAIAAGSTALPFDPVLVGVVAHLVISIGWAYGYTDLALRNPALNRAPWISGSVFGLLVFLGMQSILLSVHQFHAFTPLGFLNATVLHTLAFGVPIALIVARSRSVPQ